MKPPARLRRRSRPALFAQVRSYWLVAAVAAVLFVAVARLAVTAPAFQLAALNVTGLAHVSRDEVVRRAALDPHANIWLLDRRAIERRLAAIPYVATARVHRRPLANVWLEITERRPEGCVRDPDGATYLVDAELRVLQTSCARIRALTYKVRSSVEAAPGDFLHVPEVVALQSDARALAAADGATSGATRYRAFAHDKFGELEATLQNGIAVRFGDDTDLGAKQRLVAPILAGLGPRAATVRSVDLRAPATPVVEYRAAPRESPPPRAALQKR